MNWTLEKIAQCAGKTPIAVCCESNGLMTWGEALALEAWPDEQAIAWTDEHVVVMYECEGQLGAHMVPRVPTSNVDWKRLVCR